MYKINVLSSEDFDGLGNDVTRGSDISDSLGFADPQTGNAYVRYTGIDELNKYLIEHELEELQNSDSTHEDENGIRHKKFFKQVAMPIVWGAVKGFLGSGILGAVYGAIKSPFDTRDKMRAKKSQQDAEHFAEQAAGQQKHKQETERAFDASQAYGAAGSPNTANSPLSEFGLGSQATTSPGSTGNVQGGMAQGIQAGLAPVQTGVSNQGVPKKQTTGDPFKAAGNYAGRLVF